MVIEDRPSPSKIVIEGQYWDTQIYADALHLFDAEGNVQTVDWKKRIELAANKREGIQTAIRIAFSDASLFYENSIQKLFLDSNYLKLTLDQLKRLASKSHRFRLKQSGEKRKPIGLKYLSTDTEVYNNRLIIAADEGLFTTTFSKTSRLFKHHDGKTLRVRGSRTNSSIAFSGGSDGLFEAKIDQLDSHNSFLDEPKNLSQQVCNNCEWGYRSIFGWNQQSAVLASFKERISEKNKRNKVRVFDQLLSDKEMFAEAYADKNVSAQSVWGSDRKVFFQHKSSLLIANYTPPSPYSPLESQTKSDVHPSFSPRGSAQFELSGDHIIAVGTSSFGTVVEFDKKIVVLRSDGETDIFEGEAVHWRVFPRSIHYHNQLHIIYDDRVEIIAFVHDYFVDQEEKLFGNTKHTK